MSQTALITATIRAIHNEHHAQRIFEDPIAAQLLNDADRELCEKLLLDGFKAFAPSVDIDLIGRNTALSKVVEMGGGSAFVLSRARYTEDLLEFLISQGVSQYVLLGAGLDTFALRNNIDFKKLKVFEVDHPATQKAKQEKIVTAGLALPALLEFVPCDFTQTQVDESLLAASSFSTAKHSFFSWLGVTYYLSRETIFDVVRAIRRASTSESSLVFDFLDPDTFNPDRSAERFKPVVDGVVELGEPFLSGLSPETLEQDLAECGFQLRELLSPIEIQSRYFSGRKDSMYAAEHAYFAWASAK